MQAFTKRETHTLKYATLTKLCWLPLYLNRPFLCLIFLWVVVRSLFSYSKLHGFHLLPLFLSSVSVWNTNWCKPKRCEIFLTLLPFNPWDVYANVTWHLKKNTSKLFFFFNYCLKLSNVIMIELFAASATQNSTICYLLVVWVQLFIACQQWMKALFTPYAPSLVIKLNSCHSPPWRTL